MPRHIGTGRRADSKRSEDSADEIVLGLESHLNPIDETVEQFLKRAFDGADNPNLRPETVVARIDQILKGELVLDEFTSDQRNLIFERLVDDFRIVPPGPDKHWATLVFFGSYIGRAERFDPKVDSDFTVTGTSLTHDATLIYSEILGNDNFCSANPKLTKILLRYFDFLLHSLREKRLLGESEIQNLKRRSKQSDFDDRHFRDFAHANYEDIPYDMLGPEQRLTKALAVFTKLREMHPHKEQIPEIPTPSKLDPESIKAIYRLLSLYYHPDRKHTQDHQLFASLSTAYAVIEDRIGR